MVTDLVHVAARALRMLRRDTHPDSMSPLTPALGVVHAGAPITVSDFARQYGCTQPSASQMLAKLEACAWVERTRSTRDRRVSTFHLTDDGRRHYQQARQRAGKLLAPALEHLSSHDRAGLRRTITALEQVLDQMPQEPHA